MAAPVEALLRAAVPVVLVVPGLVVAPRRHELRQFLADGLRFLEEVVAEYTEGWDTVLGRYVEAAHA